jgi:large subunit ribosomal protein L18e
MRINVENKDVKEWLDVLEQASKGQHYGALWEKVHYELAIPSRIRASVNLYKINKLTKDGDNVIVPGKVLSVGSMDHKINIAAVSYSGAARKALTDAKCNMVGIKEMVKMNRVNLII